MNMGPLKKTPSRIYNSFESKLNSENIINKLIVTRKELSSLL